MAMNYDLAGIIQTANNAAAAARQAYAAAQQAVQIAQNTNRVIESVNSIAGETRKLSDFVIKGMKVSGDVTSSGERPDIMRVENIPGRRVPFDVIVKIPIGANDTTPQDGQHTLSQDGPFVAVVRYAIFLSSYVFQVTVDAATATYNGRSYGRYRPVSSTLDLFDAAGGWTLPVGAAAPGDGLMDVVSSNNHAGFRTMEFDGTIEVESGSGYKRQSEAVPSALWASGFDFSRQLPVLDFFERGDVIRFRVQPNHVNNPAAGNIQNVVGVLPFLDSQFDGHEGIGYEHAIASGDDIVSRQPDGILILGFHGFKILGAPTMP